MTSFLQENCLSTEPEVQFLFFRPDFAPTTEGVCVGYRVNAHKNVAEITVHHMKKGFTRGIARTAVSGKAKAGKCYEIVVVPQAVEASVVLGAKFFLLTRGVL